MEHWLTYSLPHTDIESIRLKLKATPGQRVLGMLDAREWVMSAFRARLRDQYPDVSDSELNLKIFEEIERAKQFSRPPRVLR
jgi:hypothetical protein